MQRIVVVTNQERHNKSVWTQKYKDTIRTTFVEEARRPFNDAFRRPRKRIALADPLPKLRADANNLRRDAVIALTRHSKRGPRFSVLKDGVERVTTALSEVKITRAPFERSLRQHNSRCEYCTHVGGDLECALYVGPKRQCPVAKVLLIRCDVIAHTSCYLSAWKELTQRGPVCFKVEAEAQWICTFCESDLQEVLRRLEALPTLVQEYDTQIKRIRHDKRHQKELSCARLIAGYTRMSKEARMFLRKKECAVQIQARIRGKLARKAFNEMQRQRIRPYVVDLVSLHGLGIDSEAIKSPRPPIGDDGGETRLPNGFQCNPYIVFHIVSEHDDEAQQFCFESAIQHGSNEVGWNEAIFVPGVDGNVTMCFTVLSKNGPNNFFLGQGTVRMNGTEIWRYGASLELPIKPELEVIPKASHNKLMRIQDIGSIARDLTLTVNIRHFADSGANCGYMQSINTIDSVKGNSRWCVLADGVFRIYRHYGLTLAFETLKMVHASEVQLLTVAPHHIANLHKHTAKQSTVVFIQHEQRSYLLRADSNKANATWAKKLLLAMKHKY
ncbi:hypothetical protein ACHHYP_05149 [Achlya hypogyna]|uniref:PH domain-containing protein n=1 Tax=Achlya hypogyna TaxID=1202772 RepID=A0A1V9YYS6_ACHHY|nr:hypothetical protein ACHHYP_05149 [Achlya hypogyna]